MSTPQELIHSCAPYLLVDAGSRNGLPDLSALHPFSDYIGFDPAEDAFKSNHKYITERHLSTALSDKIGEADFYGYAHPSMSSLLEFDEELFLTHFGLMENSAKWKSQFELRSKSKIRVQTLDAVFENEVPKQIDFLKLDTQGSELAVLKGASKLLSMGCIKVIKCEVAFLPVYKNQAVFADVFALLKSHGYELANLQYYPETSLQWGKTALDYNGFRESVRYGSGADALFYLNTPPQLSENLRIGILLAAANVFSLAAAHFQRTGMATSDIKSLLQFIKHKTVRNPQITWKNYAKMGIKKCLY